MSDGALRIASVRSGPELTIYVNGTVDLSTERELRRALRHGTACYPTRLVVDFAGVAFCDCRGYAVLVDARREADAGAIDFSVVHLNDAAHRAVRTLGLVDLLNVAPPAAGRAGTPDRPTNRGPLTRRPPRG